MPLRDLLTRQSEHIGRHAIERRPPEGTVCVDCRRSEPGTETEPVVLAECSICRVWRCTRCYAQHSAPAGWDDPKPPWWKRALKAVRRG